MGGGDHLGEVNHSDVVFVVQHEVKLVEVAVDEAVVPQLDKQLHTLVVGGPRVSQLPHLTPEGENDMILFRHVSG